MAEPWIARSQPLKVVAVSVGGDDGLVAFFADLLLASAVGILVPSGVSVAGATACRLCSDFSCTRSSLSPGVRLRVVPFVLAEQVTSVT